MNAISETRRPPEAISFLSVCKAYRDCLNEGERITVESIERRLKRTIGKEALHRQVKKIHEVAKTSPCPLHNLGILIRSLEQMAKH